jgi:sugar lactone lactonase YvrE
VTAPFEQAALRYTVPGEESFRTLADLVRCEAVARGPEGDLWAGDDDGAIHRIDPASGAHEVAGHVSGGVLGLCLDGAGRVYACVPDHGRVDRLDPATGTLDVYCESAGGEALVMPNWPVFTRGGTLLISDSGVEDLERHSGRVVAAPPGGGEADVVIAGPLAFANGMALAPDGTLFVIESFAQRVIARSPAGELSIHADLPGTIPDGLALDADGGLLVACYHPNRVLRVPPGGGEVETLLDDWTGIRLLTPTNAAFYGHDLAEVAIASLCGFSISAMTPPRRGMPLNYPGPTEGL